MPRMRSLMLLAMRFTTSSPFSDPSATSALHFFPSRAMSSRKSCGASPLQCIVAVPSCPR